MKMWKIAIMSDNHGDDTQIEDLLRMESDADCFVHCGDSETWQPALLKQFYAVKGNNDWALDLKNTLVFEKGGHQIMVTHGHHCGYFGREQILAEMAKERGCDVVFCGHTHIPMDCVVDGVHIINPGSTRLPRGGSDCSYCVCFLEDNDIHVSFRLIATGDEIDIGV